MDYWKRKADEHQMEAANLGVLFYVLMFVAAGVILFVSVEYVIPLMDGNESAIWPLAILSVAVAATAWPVRITSKLYLSARHLREDAREREIIARTFLALGAKWTYLSKTAPCSWPPSSGPPPTAW